MVCDLRCVVEKGRKKVTVSRTTLLEMRDLSDFGYPKLRRVSGENADYTHEHKLVCV